MPCWSCFHLFLCTGGKDRDQMNRTDERRRRRMKKERRKLHCRRAHTICSTQCVLEHLNRRVEIRFNYTCNNFKVSMGRETICMLISMTVVMTCNKSNICCLIKSDIRVLPKSAFAIRLETTC